MKYVWGRQLYIINIINFCGSHRKYASMMVKKNTRLCEVINIFFLHISKYFQADKIVDKLFMGNEG